MFETILKNFLPRVVQDVVTAIVGALAAHGYIASDQTQATIGSLFFLAMLVVNYFVSQQHKANAAQAGAAVAIGIDPRAQPLSPSVVSAIAKGKKL